MHLPSLLSQGMLSLTLVAGLFLATPSSSTAKDKHHKHHSSKHSYSSSRHSTSRHSYHHYSRDSYFSHPRSSWVVSLGTGYAGRGYYYGPPNADYYYDGPGVVYYARRDMVPSRYMVSSYGSGYSSYADSGSMDAAVQQALARRGYYHGPIDGEIGPMSRQAILRYQQDHGLRMTGYADSSLMASLGL